MDGRAVKTAVNGGMGENRESEVSYGNTEVDERSGKVNLRERLMDLCCGLF